MWTSASSGGLPDREGAKGVDDRTKPRVSVVIRAKNEAGSIGRVLDSVFTQDFKDFEVIIVDSGSTDGTLEIAGRYPVELVAIAPEDFTFGYASNVGTEKARGEFAVYLSADALPADSRWLGNLLSPFADPRVAGVYGRQAPYPGHNPIEEWKLGRVYGTGRRVQARDPFFSNANSCVRRSVWRRAPFDESLPGTEDHVWAKAVQGLGFSIVYEPSAVVYHSHGAGLRGLYRRRLREAEGLCIVNGGRRLLARRLVRPPFRAWVSVLAFLTRRRYSYKWFFYALATETVEWWAGIAGSARFRARKAATSPTGSAAPWAEEGGPASGEDPRGLAGRHPLPGQVEAGKAGPGEVS